MCYTNRFELIHFIKMQLSIMSETYHYGQICDSQQKLEHVGLTC